MPRQTWACQICGQHFLTLEACQKHERDDCEIIQRREKAIEDRFVAIAERVFREAATELLRREFINAQKRIFRRVKSRYPGTPAHLFLPLRKGPSEKAVSSQGPNRGDQESPPFAKDA